jgi:hypothetical protein
VNKWSVFLKANTVSAIAFNMGWGSRLRSISSHLEIDVQIFKRRTRSKFQTSSNFKHHFKDLLEWPQDNNKAIFNSSSPQSRPIPPNRKFCRIQNFKHGECQRQRTSTKQFFNSSSQSRSISPYTKFRCVQNLKRHFKGLLEWSAFMKATTTQFFSSSSQSLSIPPYTKFRCIQNFKRHQISSIILKKTATGQQNDFSIRLLSPDLSHPTNFATLKISNAIEFQASS